jgi:hypothetical protein
MKKFIILLLLLTLISLAYCQEKSQEFKNVEEEEIDKGKKIKIKKR